MDVVAAALCSLGAVALVRGYTSDPLGALLLFLAFYGVHRVIRTGASQALIATPALVWTIANLWKFVPDSVVDSVRSTSPILGRAPESVSAFVLVAAVLVMVAISRVRLGGGLWLASLVALGIALLLRLVPTASSGQSEMQSSLFILLVGTEKGWTVVGQSLGALCMFLIGLGPLAVQPLPRRGGAIAGVIGALLACAVMIGLPTQSIHSYNEGALGVLVLLWTVANVLIAVGLGAAARAGAKPAGWIGVGLVVFGIVSVLPALAIFDKTDANAYGLFMAAPFGLLGVGITLFGWKGAPLELGRKALGTVFITAFATGTLAWIATFLALAHVTKSRMPWGLARLSTEPLALYGLLLWAALLAYLVSPPSVGPHPPQGPASPYPHPHPHGPAPGGRWGPPPEGPAPGGAAPPRF